MEQSVPKRRRIKFRRRGITQKKDYNIQNRRKFEIKKYYSDRQIKKDKMGGEFGPYGVERNTYSPSDGEASRENTSW
jgi:hypothetical protein